MYKDKLKNIADELFLGFTQEFPQSAKGDYLSPQTNEVLAFERYFNRLSDEQIRLLADTALSPAELKRLRKIINNGIEKYLVQNIKTLALY